MARGKVRIRSSCFEPYKISVLSLDYRHPCIKH